MRLLPTLSGPAQEPPAPKDDRPATVDTPSGPSWARYAAGLEVDGTHLGVRLHDTERLLAVVAALETGGDLSECTRGREAVGGVTEGFAV